MKKNNDFCLKPDDEVLLRRYLYSRSGAEMVRLEMQLPDEKYIHQVLRELIDKAPITETKVECRTYVDEVLTEKDRVCVYYFSHGSPVQVESLFSQFNKNSVTHSCYADSGLIYRDLSTISYNLKQENL